MAACSPPCCATWCSSAGCRWSPYAGSLVLQTTELTPASAAEATRPYADKTFSPRKSLSPLGISLKGRNLPGLDSTLAPVTAAEQDDALFVVARDPAGQEVMLRHTPKTAGSAAALNPGPCFAAAQAISQAHIFFISSDSAGGKLQLVAYHTITNTWAVSVNGRRPARSSVRSRLSNGFVVTTRDAVGKPHLTQAELIGSKRGLKVIDYVVIVLYLCVVAGIGICLPTSREKRIPRISSSPAARSRGWAAGLSLYATGTSAISYLAIPAKSYSTNWLYLAQNVITFVGSFYVAFVIVPLVRRLNLISVYQYLEMRFHPMVRMMASLICIVQHLAGRMSVVLLLPALALSAVTGISLTTTVLLMGVVTTIYTFLGGMKAVIWTDVLQVFVMVGGAIFAMTWMIHGSGGLGAVTHIALADGKTHMFDWSFDFSIPNVWTFVLMLIVGTLTWPQDQVNTQRVLATKDDKAARGSVFMLTALALPGSFMFFGLGTLLYTYYKVHPAGLNPLLTTDQIFPQFIASDLPSGVTGLIIAGIFAASMATLSSNINSIATLVSVDFYERYAKHPTPSKSVRLAEWTTLITGAIGTGLALYLSTLDIRSLWDKFIELMALLGGGFSGIYALGMFTRRANWQGAVTGIIASIVATVLTKLLLLLAPRADV